MQKPAIAIANEIDLAERRRETSTPHKYDIINLLERQVGLLEVTEGISLSLGLAEFAVQAYARGDKTCHSGTYEQEAEEKAEKLHKILRAHRRGLAHILPECEQDESVPL